MAPEEDLASFDLAPASGSKETNDEGNGHPGEQDHNAREDPECDPGTDLLHMSREFRSERGESLAQFFPASGHGRHYIRIHPRLSFFFLTVSQISNPPDLKFEMQVVFAPASSYNSRCENLYFERLVPKQNGRAKPL